MWDALRKTIQISAQFCKTYDLTEWRQSQHLLRTIKKNYRLIQKLKHSTSKDEVKRQAKQDEIKEAHRVYIEQGQGFVQRVRVTSRLLKNDHGVTLNQLAELEGYLTHAERQINQIRRRVLQGETIPHEEKVFSLFQPHTEWISKGKAGVPVELGLRVCVVEDSYRFILHHQVMEKTTDDQIAVSIVKDSQSRFPALNTISMDKGFHSPNNQIQLKERLDLVILPKKVGCPKQIKYVNLT